VTAASTDLRQAGVLRRAKPLLGTLVDIGIGATDAEIALAAADAAFAEIRDAHRLMSFHDASSDLSRINRAAPHQRVDIDPRTADVLRLALEIGTVSAGAFDCTVAPVLVRHGLLPQVPDARPRTFRDPPAARTPAFVVEDCAVIKQRDCLLDLGGIAKGYAVDRAVDAALALAGARGHRLDSVFVNAGGDLRFHGASTMTIRLRDFDDPARLTGAVEIAAGALATSSTRGLDGPARRVSPLVDPHGATPLPMGAGVSVTAPTCAVADALTKVALVAGDRAHAVLARYGASIVRVSAQRAPLAETP